MSTIPPTPMPEASAVVAARLAALRTEIIETQKSSADLLKWKLIATATVASLALGLWKPAGATTASEGKLLACLMPFICAYVDLISLDLGLRIMVVASYLRDRESDPYEKHVQSLRTGPNPFRFAPVAIHASSILVNILLIGIGLAGAAQQSWTRLEVCVFLMTGLVGLFLTIILWLAYTSRVRALGTAAPALR